MKELGMGCEPPLIAHDEAPTVPRPSKGPFDRPSLGITLHDSFWAHAQISCKEILITIGSCTIMDVDPTDFHKRFPDTVPVPCAGGDLDVSDGSPIPRDHERVSKKVIMAGYDRGSSGV
jgi:hypothetical protein